MQGQFLNYIIKKSNVICTLKKYHKILCYEIKLKAIYLLINYMLLKLITCVSMTKYDYESCHIFL